jgi:hypothetical protein
MPPWSHTCTPQGCPPPPPTHLHRVARLVLLCLQGTRLLLHTPAHQATGDKLNHARMAHNSPTACSVPWPDMRDQPSAPTPASSRHALHASVGLSAPAQPSNSPPPLMQPPQRLPPLLLPAAARWSACAWRRTRAPSCSRSAPPGAAPPDWNRQHVGVSIGRQGAMRDEGWAAKAHDSAANSVQMQNSTLACTRGCAHASPLGWPSSAAAAHAASPWGPSPWTAA